MYRNFVRLCDVAKYGQNNKKRAIPPFKPHILSLMGTMLTVREIFTG